MKFISRFFNRYLSSEKHFAHKLGELIGFTPANLKVFQLAFLHSSVTEDSNENNERLEFLGDAILGSVVTEFLFRKYPYRSEGFLTEMRSKIVSRNQLKQIGLKLGLDELLQFNQNDRYLLNSSIIGNCLEALVGAVYLDSGYKSARKFVVRRIIQPFLDMDELEKQEHNHKSRLIEWAQKEGKQVSFEMLEKVEHKNKNTYIMGVFIDGKQMGKGQGPNKKTAEQRASEMALEDIVGDE